MTPTVLTALCSGPAPLPLPEVGDPARPGFAALPAAERERFAAEVAVKLGDLAPPALHAPPATRTAADALDLAEWLEILWLGAHLTHTWGTP